MSLERAPQDRGQDCNAARFALLQRAERRVEEAKAGTDGSIDDSGSAQLRDAYASSLDAHLSRCAACRRDLARAEVRIAFLRDLARVEAPAEMDGAIVAALQAGARQSRAIRALTALTPFSAPDALARRIAVSRTPAVLDRLVGEDLVDPAKALASRYAGRLERLRAPADLEHRLGSAGPRPATRVLTTVLLAAGLVLVLGSLVLTQVLRPRHMGTETAGTDSAQARSGTQAADRGPLLIVEHVDSVRSLDPVAADVLSGFTGGWVDAQRIAREKL